MDSNLYTMWICCPKKDLNQSIWPEKYRIIKRAQLKATVVIKQQTYSM